MSGGLPMNPSHCEPERVVGVQFEMFKAAQVKEHAVCCINEAKSYLNERPVPGGISDLRMGSTDRDLTCETCRMPHPECPGHFGYVDLAEPMFNIGVFDVTIQALRCVCKSCGALLCSPKDSGYREAVETLKGAARLSAIAKICTHKKRCEVREQEGDGYGKGCGQEQISTKRPLGLYPQLKLDAVQGDATHHWYGEDVYAVLDRISDADARLLGFNPDRCHPRDLLVTVLPVPPPQVRPSVSFGSARSENELSHKLLSIVKSNQKMLAEKHAGVGRESIDEARQVLQEHIATYMHNASTYYQAARQGRMPLKSISERLKGKYGRVRGNLMGKRVDFSARTVITGDPCIDVDEVGVPYSVAMTLTFPERVNAANRKRLTETVRRQHYPSANYIIRGNGVVQKLAFLKSREDLNLDVGDVVERHVINGDVVLFNRQPTLHRMSMMGHRARVLPFNTFRLNLSCTTPYNADFDGDEMNLHVAQSLLTKAELIEMMMVPKNFVSPGKSQPCMGIVQDSLLGCYRLTNKDTFVDKYFMQNIVMWLDRWELPIPAVVKPQPLWTGKQVFSMILPQVTHGNPKFDAKPNALDQDDKALFIRRGELLTGLVKKSDVGASPGSLIQIIANEAGPDEVARFINGVQRTTAYFLYNVSFSVGVQDTVADQETLDQVKVILKKMSKQVREVAAKANEGQLKRRPGMTLLKTFETEVNGILNKARDSASEKALQSLPQSNNFKRMIESGSKGSNLNICQIAVMVGQQNVAGQRIAFGFRRRTLPHFVQDDYGQASRGMVINGYLVGLKPEEFFFHTMGGREGLIDTAVKTADTGYLQRKLVKALEDLHSGYDGTVRNANHDIVQFMYGEDGLDGSKIERDQDVAFIFKGDAAMRDTYRFEYAADGAFTEAVGEDYMDMGVKRALRANPQAYAVLEEEYQQVLRDRQRAREVLEIDSSSSMKLCLPVNIARLVRNAQAAFGVRPKTSISNLNPVTIVENVRRLQGDIRQFFASHHKAPGGGGAINDPIGEQRISDALGLFFMHLRTLLSSKRVIREYRLNDRAFHFLLGEVRLRYLQSIVPAGEMIGPIAAQSCGEPATQMTLNTFHNAGISSKNVTLGVPRLLELLNVSRNQRISNMIIALTPEWQDRRSCDRAAHMIEYASLETVTRRMEIFYDPDPANTVVEADKAFVADEWDPAFCSDEEWQRREVLRQTMSPWVMRVELDKAMVQDKRIELKTVKHRIEANYDDESEGYYVEYSKENVGDPVVRLRLKSWDPHADVVEVLKRDVPVLLGKVRLAGIPGIVKVLSADAKRFPEDPATGELRTEKVHHLETEGTALRTVMSRVTDDEGTSIVDHTRTSSNNIPEVFRILGIEAARRKLFLEMRAAYVNYSVFINYRHYSVLIDAMCHRGYLMAVSRTGINRSDAGPLMCASFEETVKILMGAAAFGVRDPAFGVSAGITLGNQVGIGTGIFDLMLNTTVLRDAIPQAEAVKVKGTDPNIYHGLSSVADPGVQPEHDAVPMGATPLITEHSALHGHRDVPRFKGLDQSVSYAAEATPAYGAGIADAAAALGGAGLASVYQPAELSAAHTAAGAGDSAYQPFGASEAYSPYDPHQADSAAFDLASQPYGVGAADPYAYGGVEASELDSAPTFVSRTSASHYSTDLPTTTYATTTMDHTTAERPTADTARSASRQPRSASYGGAAEGGSAYSPQTPSALPPPEDPK